MKETQETLCDVYWLYKGFRMYICSDGMSLIAGIMTNSTKGRTRCILDGKRVEVNIVDLKITYG